MKAKAIGILAVLHVVPESAVDGLSGVLVLQTPGFNDKVLQKCVRQVPWLILGRPHHFCVMNVKVPHKKTQHAAIPS